MPPVFKGWTVTKNTNVRQYNSCSKRHLAAKIVDNSGIIETVSIVHNLS